MGHHTRLEGGAGPCHRLGGRQTLRGHAKDLQMLTVKEVFELLLG